MTMYTTKFFAGVDEGAAETPSLVVPLVLDLLAVRSVVDIGCGTGRWLQSFGEHGVTDVLGVDGPWVPADLLRIPPDRFIRHDLSAPLRVDRTFDLAMSIEVAEHLPADVATMFVRQLTELAPAILFSAAIPGQGGTGHVNEQWPEYWNARFDHLGYRVLDPFRSRIWHEGDVAVSVRQNLLLYASDELIQSSPELAAARRGTDLARLSVVHPGQYARVTEADKMSLRRALATLPRVAAAAARRRLPVAPAKQPGR